MRFFIIALLISSSLLGGEETLAPIYSAPNPYFPKVNLVTGEYHEECVDLELPIPETLRVFRIYHHFSPYQQFSGAWLFNPDSLLFANFELESQSIFFALGNEQGGIQTYSKKEGQSLCLSVNDTRSLMIDPEFQTERAHPANVQLNYTKEWRWSAWKWEGTIKRGDGSSLGFTSGSYNWLKSQTRIRRVDEFEFVDEIPPSRWTPYQLRLTKERRSSGNWIDYSYRNARIGCRTPAEQLLTKILYEEGNFYEKNYLSFFKTNNNLDCFQLRIPRTSILCSS